MPPAGTIVKIKVASNVFIFAFAEAERHGYDPCIQDLESSVLVRLHQRPVDYAVPCGAWRFVLILSIHQSSSN